jgi:hypothetical protein
VATVKITEYPQILTSEMLVQWGALEIPVAKNAPLLPIDLTEINPLYGVVYIKDESIHPKGTIKYRLALGLARWYKNFATTFLERNRKISGGHLVPRISFITAGNEGLAVVYVFNEYNLPPPKILIDTNMPAEHTAILLKSRADIYATDLGAKALTGDDIKQLTDNQTTGPDITSIHERLSSHVFSRYGRHVKEVFSESPWGVYVPHGGGITMRSYFTEQIRLHGETNGKAPICNSHIFGAEPKNENSVAQKLNAMFKPFIPFRGTEIDGLIGQGVTGDLSGIYSTFEESIVEGQNIYNVKNVNAEPSSSTALGLYCQHCREGVINPKKKIIVVNSGKGLFL